MDWPEVERKVKRSFKIFGLRDSELFMDLPVERPAGTRLAMYLQEAFPEYHVDCDYGRYETSPKNLETNRRIAAFMRRAGLQTNYENWRRIGSNKIEPDIIVHRRRVQDHNLLFIELKPKSYDKKDSVKLVMATAGVTVLQTIRTGTMTQTVHGDFQYKFGLQINLRLDKTPHVGARARLWQNGMWDGTYIDLPY